MRSRLKTLLLAAVALTFIAGPVRAAEPFTPEQKAAIDTMIGDYLKAHPEVIIESVNGMQAKAQKEMQDKAAENIGKNMDFLASATAPSIGNPKGDVTIIEFFDYHCGYCKRAVPDIQALIQSDKNVRVVFHEMPILSPDSKTAALWALAANKQGKYFEYHVKLMQTPGAMNEDALSKIAKDVGLDVEKMKKDAASPTVTAELEKSISVAREIGVTGTPAFIINGKFFPGYLGPDGLKASVEEARKGAATPKP